MAMALVLLLVAVVPAYAQPPDADADADGSLSFRPSVAIIVAIFSVMFSFTFLLLMYAKFCHNGGGLANRRAGDRPPVDAAAFLSAPRRASSGIDRAVVESLPFFLFSSLRGDRGGLECAVCLSKFDDAEFLRLLPKCSHAFHAACVDRWLESHSTCPLCRCRIDPADPALFNCSNSTISISTSSSRFLSHDPSTDNINASASASILELVVEREPDQQDKHKHKHRIVLSGPLLKSRWSDLNPSDLVSLDIRSMLSNSSNRFSADSAPVEETRIKEEEVGKKRVVPESSNVPETDPPRPSSILFLQGKRRCVSEMTSVSRFRAGGDSEEEDEEEVGRLRLPIAQRTVRWFAGRERRPEAGKDTKLELTIVSEVSN